MVPVSPVLNVISLLVVAVVSWNSGVAKMQMLLCFVKRDELGRLLVKCGTDARSAVCLHETTM
jgi:hypothetical protein